MIANQKPQNNNINLSSMESMPVDSISPCTKMFTASFSSPKQIRLLYFLLGLFLLLAILLAISLILVIVFNAQFLAQILSQQHRDSVDFLNKDKSWHGNCAPKCRAKFDVPPLLVISTDGFRADYLHRNLTPSIARLMECGARAEYMMPSFPSKTYPNHFTIVSGLYPESHGIVDNSFYDSKMNAYFDKASKNPVWYSGEPIWNTVAKNGKKSGIFFWPGSEVPVQGILPTYRVHYDTAVPFSHRVDQVISWLKLDDAERPSFLGMYFDQPDSAMHLAGPHSDAVNSAMIYVDAMINYLMQKLDNNGLLGCINIIIVSDHGGHELLPELFLPMDKFVNPNDHRVGAVLGGAIGHINFRNSSADSEFVESTLELLKCNRGKNFRVYTPPTMPIRYHYTQSISRIGDLLLDSVPGSRLFVTQKSLNETGWIDKGDHGYDNRIPEMRAIFGAWGPSIKGGGQIVKAFQNIELYNLFVALMKLPMSARNNGTFGRMNSVLRRPDQIQNTLKRELPICENENDEHHHHEGNEFCQIANRISIPEELASKNGDSPCFIAHCNETMVYHAEKGRINFVENLLEKSNLKGEKANEINLEINSADFNSSKLETKKIANENAFISLTLENDFHENVRVPVPYGFKMGPWKQILILIAKYTQHYGQMIAWTGPIFDQNYDGLADDPILDSSKLTQIFVILLRCPEGKWHKNGRNCAKTEETETMAFVLPLLGEDLNCLPPGEYLSRHIARIRDIELLTGNEWFMEGDIYSRELAILLRTHLAEQFWNL